MPDIAAELHVSRGSVSLWTRDVPFEPRYHCSHTHRAIMGLVDALLPSMSHSGVAQSAEQGTVNAKVLGSSPSPGAISDCTTVATAGQ